MTDAPAPDVAAPDVVVLGDANPDLLLHGDVVPRFGQTEQLVSAADLVVGGSGAIVAHGLARLGRRVRMVAAVGEDSFADLLRERLAAAGVDVSGLVVTGPVTGLTVVLAPDDHQARGRAVLTHLGTIPDLDGDRAAEALELAAADGARHVHVASLFLMPALVDALPDVMRQAKSLGLTTSLDTNYDPAERWDGVTSALEHVDLLLPNATEACALAARLPVARPPDDPVESAARLAELGPTVVVKLGSGGAAHVDPGGRVTRVPAPPTDAVDTTGAGDTLDAAYLDGMLRGLDPDACLARAVAAAAISTTAVGGTAGQPEELP